MSKLNLAAIKKLTSNTITAAALRDAGISWVPVMPDGSLADLALAAFIQAGQPEGDGFFTHNGDDIKLFAPEEWERNRHTKAGPAKCDPINGEPLTEVTLAAYNALAPIKLLGGGSVPAIELLAYGAEKHLLPVDLTSREARRLPKGTEPIAPDDDLKPAAREWPYDTNAAEFARRRLERGIPTPAPIVRRVRDGGQTLVNNGPVGQQFNIQSGNRSRDAKLADGLVAVFSRAELARFLRYNVDASLESALPGESVAMSVYTAAAVDALRSRGLIDGAFFDALIRERPRVTAIHELRPLYGV